MKKIFAGLAVALLLGACSPAPQQAVAQNNGWGDNDSVQVCMDKSTGQRIPDNQCQQANYASNNGSSISPFIWYYLGMNAAIPAYYSPIPLGYGAYRPVYGYHYHAIGPRYYSVYDRGSLYRPNSVVVQHVYHTAPVVHMSAPVNSYYRAHPTTMATGSALSRGTSNGTVRPASSNSFFRPSAPAASVSSGSAYRPSSSFGSSYRSSFGGGSSSSSSRSSYSSSSHSGRH